MRRLNRHSFQTALIGGFVFFNLAFFSQLLGQIILTEVMNNPTGSETAIPGGDSNEYIEIFNAGEDSVDLTGWSFSDGDDVDFLSTGEFRLSPLPLIEGIYNSMILAPGAFALILDPEYVDPANNQPYNWPSNTLILSIQTTTDLGGSRLATNDPITLFNEHGTEVDSFPVPFDPGDGISAERVSIDGDSWSACIAPSGHTAGARNSRWPFGRDLSIDSVSTPENPVASSPISVYVYISNVGESFVGTVTIRLFESSDTSAFNLLDSETITNIEISENRVIELTADLSEGAYNLFASLSDDDNLSNNSGSLRIFIGPSGWPVCVSEFMFMPITGEPEWIEIHNWGEIPIDLTGWSFGDELTLYEIPPCTLEPGGFAVLVENLANFSDTLCEGAILLGPSRWAILNNTSDVVRIVDSDGLLRQSIPYSSGQFGSCMTNGVSAEVIEAGSSQLACCPAGRTAGCANAIWFITPGRKSISADPNPFDPTKERTTVSFELPSAGIGVYVYDRLGRRVATLVEPNRPVGMQVEWDGRDDSGQILPSGMFILFAKDSEGNSAKAVIALEGGR